MGGIIDSWEYFCHNGMSLFQVHAPDKLGWPGMISSIVGHIAELDQLRKLLVTKRERFKFKLESVSSIEISHLHSGTWKRRTNHRLDCFDNEMVYGSLRADINITLEAYNMPILL